MIDSPYRSGCGHPDEPERFCPGCLHAEHHGRCAECGQRCIAERFDRQLRATFKVGVGALAILLWFATATDSLRVCLVALILLPLWLALSTAVILLLRVPVEASLRRPFSRTDRRPHAESERDAAD